MYTLYIYMCNYTICIYNMYTYVYSLYMYICIYTLSIYIYIYVYIYSMHTYALFVSPFWCAMSRMTEAQIHQVVLGVLQIYCGIIMIHCSPHYYCYLGIYLIFKHTYFYLTYVTSSKTIHPSSKVDTIILR